VSAFGGVIAVNAEVTQAMARQVAEVFTEVIIAPGFEDEALATLTSRKNLRVLRCPPPGSGPAVEWRPLGSGPAVEWRPLGSGLLMQQADQFGTPGDEPGGWELRAGQPASAEDLADLAFAWRACRSVKSNAIVVASGGATVGVGMGQVNRVDAARLAVARAGERAHGAVAASDAYFPFPDGLEVLTGAGIRAVVEPGGSVRDGLAIEAAEAAGVSLYFTGTRHFFH
jgi:phosphoribosylaminoimidazolecarboxamide formyltransferase/IMP cyclohydrolase